ncbi:hypothetical protein E3N88_12069 [Mikania micrantha]|uniref:Uncharacterized protein n=1 Tax=Mikania micrantha TaxID=192012 RepID=A0A5N6P4G5_9ASTR|nr:hypothetical protein E3N88_12069 [Mikania micrantha]
MMKGSVSMAACKVRGVDDGQGFGQGGRFVAHGVQKVGSLDGCCWLKGSFPPQVRQRGLGSFLAMVRDCGPGSALPRLSRTCSFEHHHLHRIPWFSCCPYLGVNQKKFRGYVCSKEGLRNG